MLAEALKDQKGAKTELVIHKKGLNDQVQSLLKVVNQQQSALDEAIKVAEESKKVTQDIKRENLAMQFKTKQDSTRERLAEQFRAKQNTQRERLIEEMNRDKQEDGRENDYHETQRSLSKKKLSDFIKGVVWKVKER